MMSSENDSLIDLANMAKWLMNESQQPSVTQELGRLFPSIGGRGRRGESSELLLRVGAGESSASATDTNNTSFATRPTRKRTIEEIWGSKASSKKPPKSMSHKTTSGKTPSKFAALSQVKSSDFRFVTWLRSSCQEMFCEKVFCEFCEISKNTFPYRTPLVATSVDSCHFTSLISHDCSLTVV